MGSTSSNQQVAVEEAEKLSYYLPLHEAARDGDWKKASEFIARDPAALTAIISFQNATALHVAAYYGQSDFVEKIVQLMSAEAVTILDGNRHTALHHIAAGGTIKAAMALVEKNPSLTEITTVLGHTPLYYLCANNPLISSRETEMLWYLSLVTEDKPPTFCFSGDSAPNFLLGIFASGHFDVCLYLLQKHSELARVAILGDGYNSIIGLCMAASEFQSGCKLSFFESCIYKIVPLKVMSGQELFRIEIQVPPPPPSTRPSISMQLIAYSSRAIQCFTKVYQKAVIEQLLKVPSIKQVYDIKLRHQHSLALLHYICQLLMEQKRADLSVYFIPRYVTFLHMAAEMGIVEIVAVFVRYFPDMMVLSKSSHETLLHVAIENRREKLFNLLMELSAPLASPIFTRLESRENILHLAAKLAPSLQLNSVSGPALQMQRELQWFKEVEKLVSNQDKQLRNRYGKTPREIFTEEHRELKGKGEQWMRDTSNSSMVVTTLIATIAFAAAITVPGGNDSEKGTPIFLERSSFIVFAISDALALFSSVTSLIMFLAILTARYAEDDFLVSLPRKMIIGLTSLFVAIATMMIAFGAGLSIVIGEKLRWILLPVILLGFIPVALFGMLQLPLLIRMVRSTYGNSLFYCPGDRKYSRIAYKKVQ